MGKNEFDSHIAMTVLKILLFVLKSGCYRDEIHFQAARNWNFCKFNYIELVSDCLEYISSHGLALFMRHSHTHNVITAMHTHSNRKHFKCLIFSLTNKLIECCWFWHPTANSKIMVCLCGIFFATPKRHHCASRSSVRFQYSRSYCS